ncbi:uncharacterized protein LOC113308169 [Papaver somniferum]|uniref:uncharacterized protein LOC113308169 n=1 Tax=Papaver somniferum TaxID=3469 RepID=UPI000E705942|nr:uncharacterized protein LOC113308169 [Papaver somniferum]
MTSISQARAMGIWQAIAAGLLLLLQLLIASASPDLQNPDLEIPPTNSTYPFPALDSTINYLPQWFSQGDVSYVFASSQGNYRYLGKNGKITQEFKANEESSHYLLTFSLQPARTNCDNTTSVTISVPGRSVVVSFSNKFAGGNQSCVATIRQNFFFWLSIRIVWIRVSNTSNTANTNCIILFFS